MRFGPFWLRRYNTDYCFAVGRVRPASASLVSASPPEALWGATWLGAVGDPAPLRYPWQAEPFDPGFDVSTIPRQAHFADVDPADPSSDV